MSAELIVRINATADISRLALSAYCRPTTAKAHSPTNGSCQPTWDGLVHQIPRLTLHKPVPVRIGIISTVDVCTAMLNETRTDMLALPMTIAPPFSSYACQSTPAYLDYMNILHRPAVRFLLAWREAVRKNRQSYPCPLLGLYQYYPVLR